MGYNTSYTLEEVIPEDNIDHKENIWNQFDEGFDESTRWYDFEDDMKLYSLQYPTSLFKFSGIGDEYYDIWEMYVKNGKSFKTMAEFVFEEFDESKLK